MIDSFRGEYRFLSNFYPCRIEYDEDMYPSVEHAYQAAKTPNQKERDAIRDMAKAGDAKRAGRSVALWEDWENIKLQVMKELLLKKFAPGSSLAAKLLATGEELLAEGNNWGDYFWGTVDGKGENWLGRLLMEVRGELKKG